ncbi:tryptophan-rich sensory protein [Candidatus Phycorickettsia trachydisci]|uniref:Tryptophan-rich sensory protein n=1 Tax=Candidatus Phycorickettsia trachydisci TaxID=2115978 RepID=A0A2P1P7V7_9RICK|nr:TspO/MBR family protein [Candidatus Phycorickettsia trachydisci]AVP87354.1 tryptophan-rich sensory protein [Candidatus Phycorickettsia trachydisci]
MQKFKYEILGSIYCLALGMLSGYISGSGNSEWYQNLIKPSFQPPSWIFGPVWTILYIMIGIALAKVWNTKNVGLFIFQLMLNLLWSPMFFRYHRIDLALLDIALLWINLLALIYQSNQSIRLLLTPYFLWISFAGTLNYQIYMLNA